MRRIFHLYLIPPTQSTRSTKAKNNYEMHFMMISQMFLYLCITFPRGTLSFTNISNNFRSTATQKGSRTHRIVESDPYYHCITSSMKSWYKFLSDTKTMHHLAAPKRGSIVDSYQTVSVNCSKCTTRIFRYKKKNGTKSNLIKCYIERIAEDCVGALQKLQESGDEQGELRCPKCDTRLARRTLIRGRPALKFAGGKIRMTKK